MVPSNFSETQFVVGYLREYLDRPKRFWFNHFLRMPSTSTEKATGADVIIARKKVRGSSFLQFKRSDFLKDKRGLRDPQRSILRSFFPCYRFKLYNEKGSEQFNTLRRLALVRRNACAYIAPMFHTYKEFDNYLAKKEVVLNSAVIEVGQFNRGIYHPSVFTLLPGDTHHLLFNARDNNCWLCSEPTTAEKRNGFLLHQALSDVEETTFETEVSKLIGSLEEMEYVVPQLSNITSIVEQAQILAQYLYFKDNIIWIPNFTN